MNEKQVGIVHHWQFTKYGVSFKIIAKCLPTHKEQTKQTAVEIVSYLFIPETTLFQDFFFRQKSFQRFVTLVTIQKKSKIFLKVKYFQTISGVQILAQSVGLTKF